MTYLVWIGGVCDYEGSNQEIAKACFNSWIELGYDDVIFETIGA